MTDFPEPPADQGAASAFPSPVTDVSLEVSTIASAGVAVTALAAGHAWRGARLYSRDPLAVNLVSTAASANGGDTILYPAATVIDFPPTCVLNDSLMKAIEPKVKGVAPEITPITPCPLISLSIR